MNSRPGVTVRPDGARQRYLYGRQQGQGQQCGHAHHELRLFLLVKAHAGSSPGELQTDGPRGFTMGTSDVYPDVLGEALSFSSQRLAQLGSLITAGAAVEARRRAQAHAARAARAIR